MLAYKAQWASQTELRELREEVKKLKNKARKPTTKVAHMSCGTV